MSPEEEQNIKEHNLFELDMWQETLEHGDIEILA